MEVHHLHHPGRKKKWGEYLLEFLMLFFAVFLGFLAENLRERQVDKEKTGQFMHAMTENLMYDTMRCGAIARANTANAQGLDSFRYEIGKAIDGKVDPDMLYYLYFKYAFSFSHAYFNKGAFEQMRSSGSLRLIKDDKLVSDILDYYDRFIPATELGFENLTKSKDVFFESSKEVFNGRYLDEFLKNETGFSPETDTALQRFNTGMLIKHQPPHLLTTNPKNLERLYNDAVDAEGRLRVYNSLLLWTREAADTLMLHIGKLYGFEKK